MLPCCARAAPPAGVAVLPGDAPRQPRLHLRPVAAVPLPGQPAAGDGERRRGLAGGGEGLCAELLPVHGECSKRTAAEQCQATACELMDESTVCAGQDAAAVWPVLLLRLGRRHGPSSAASRGAFSWGHACMLRLPSQGVPAEAPGVLACPHALVVAAPTAHIGRCRLPRAHALLQECAKHFVRHAAGELAAGVARKRDAVLWLWRTHNIVSICASLFTTVRPSCPDWLALHVNAQRTRAPSSQLRPSRRQPGLYCELRQFQLHSIWAHWSPLPFPLFSPLLAAGEPAVESRGQGRPFQGGPRLAARPVPPGGALQQVQVPGAWWRACKLPRECCLGCLPRCHHAGLSLVGAGHGPARQIRSRQSSFSRASQIARCRKGEGVGDTKDEEIPWDEEEVYRFLLDFYSGKAPAAAAASGGGGGSGGGGSRPSGWTDAGVLLCVIAACVYGVLRKSGQYSIRKSSSRLL